MSERLNIKNIVGRIIRKSNFEELVYYDPISDNFYTMKGPLKPEEAVYYEKPNKPEKEVIQEILKPRLRNDPRYR